MVATIAIAVFASIWHFTALAAFRTAEDTGPVADRLSRARLASTLEPWDGRYARRVIALQGLELLRAGEVDAAFRLLYPYWEVATDDRVFGSVYREVMAIKMPLDARKAHQQHAREQSSGVLLEKDVIP